MKCELRVSVNMNFQYGQTVKLTSTSKCENLLRVSRIASKSATMGATQNKIIIKKNGVGMILDASKGQKKIMMFYLKAKRYFQKDKRHLPTCQKKKDNSDKKY